MGKAAGGGAAAHALKTSYGAARKISSVYLGGAVVLSPDQSCLLCACGDTVNLVQVADGHVRLTLPGVRSLARAFDGTAQLCALFRIASP